MPMVLLVVLLALLTYMLSPFWKSFIWGAILACVFYPLYERSQKFIYSSTIRALLFAFLPIALGLFVLIPILVVLVKEIVGVVNNFNKDAVLKIWAQITALSPIALEMDLNELSSQIYRGATAIMDILRSILVSSANSIAVLFLASVILFFFLKDAQSGARFARQLADFFKVDFDSISSLVISSIRASFWTLIVISGGQGLLTFFSLALAGFDFALLAGFLAFILGLLPGGTTLIYLPVGLYYLIYESFLKGIFIILFNLVSHNLIDFFLRPILFDNQFKLHSGFMFFAVLGGLYSFGFLGLFIVPSLVVVIRELLRVHSVAKL
jgi:predicted PurR-regulated permease PerM